MVAPLKKNDMPIKHLAAPAKNIIVLPKKVVVISKSLQKLAPSAIPNHDQLKAPVHEVRFPDRLHYSFNLESEVQKLKFLSH